VLPATNPSLRAYAEGKDVGATGTRQSFLAASIEFNLGRLLQAEIEYQRAIDDLKRELNLRHDFTPSAAFSLLDKNVPINKIDRYELREFCELYAKYLRDDELDAIIRRTDTDEDELLNYAEFSDAVKIQTIAAPERVMGSPTRSIRGSSPLRNTSPSRSKRATYSPVRKSPSRRSTKRSSPVRGSPTRRSPFRQSLRSSPQRTSTYHRSPPRRTTLRESPTRHRSPMRTSTLPVRGGSPMRGYEEEELVGSLKELIDYERELENLKQNLAGRHEFNLTDCFRLFDYTNTGFVSVADIQDAFNAYQVYPSREEAQLILNRFDQDGDGRLRYSEFQEMFNPKDLASSDLLVSRPSRNLDLYYPRAEYFVGYVKEDFIQVLRFLVSVETHAESLRQRQASRPLFNNSDAFSAFDRYNKSYVTQQDFADLLARHRFYATEKELCTITDRFDKNKDGRVSYGEFVKEMSPQSPSRY